MKTHLQSLLRVCSIILLITAASACKKSATPDPTPEVKTANLTAKIDGKDFTITQDAITSTYYSTEGDAVKSLATTATLNPAGDKLAFFIDDLKNGTITISKKLGTSANPGSPKLGVNTLATNAVSAVQSYVQYYSGGNSYYAYSGSIEISITDRAISIKWSITFKDASGRVTSAGSYYLPNYAAVTQPKAAVVDPTPVAAKPTIENISPTKGYAGDTVAITGVNYSTTKTENIVKFNGVEGTVLTATATKLTVKTPQTGTTGNVSVKVKNSDVTTGPVFTYIVPANITSILPTSAKVGDTVAINGINFSTVLAENAVLFGDNKLGTVISATATKLLVKVPTGATTASIQVTVANRTAVSPLFTVIATPVTPPSGNALNWQDLGLLSPMADMNQSATVGTKTLFTAGLNANYLYLVSGTTITNVYDNLPLNKTGLRINLLVSSGTAFYLTTSNGIVKSTNGETWYNITPNTAAPQQEFRGIVATNDNVTLINNSLMYASTDGGTTFTTAQVSSQVAIMDYMVSDSFGKYWYAIDISRNNKDSNPKLHYRSADKGKTWTQTSGRTGYYFFDAGYKEFLKTSGYTQFALYSPPSDTATIRGQRLYKSTDQGDSWAKLSDEQVLTVKTAGDYVMYGGYSFNVSVDNGATFKKYLTPTGYVIGSIEKQGNYFYIFCSKTGSQEHRVFRTVVTN